MLEPFARLFSRPLNIRAQGRPWRRFGPLALLFLTLLVLLDSVWLSGIPPEVTNVSVSQRRDGSKIVDIRYDLADPENDLCSVSIALSSNGGVSFGFLPDPEELSGDFGYPIAPGTGKHIIWQAGEEHFPLDGDQYVARITADDAVRPYVSNPYSGVDFSAAVLVKADFHSHTTYSDAAATATPKARIDRYRLYGYRVATIADHDSYGPQAGTTLTTRPFGTWPLSAVYADSIPLMPSPETAGGDIEYYPALDLFAVRGNELSGFTGSEPTSAFASDYFTLHHVVSLCAPMWNSMHVDRGYIYPTDLRYGNAGSKVADTEWQIAEIGVQGGLAIMAHPQKQWQNFCQGNLGDPPYPGMPGGVLPPYDEVAYPHYPYTIGWYEAILRAYPHVLGVEAYGKLRDHRQYWDLILAQTMPERPVWGFSNSDAHDVAASVGKHMNMLWLDEATPEAIRQALEQGSFYIIHDPLGADLSRHTSTPPAYPTIDSINVSDTQIAIQATNAVAVNWIHNQTVIATGPVFDASAHLDLNYIRAEVLGADGSIALTQPFGIFAP